MNKTELAVMLARERVKAQAELLERASSSNPELAQILKGASLYDHALTESLNQIDSTKKPKKDNREICWYCREEGLNPSILGDACHPYKLCMLCGATSTTNELHPYHRANRLPYRKLANQVKRLLGDAGKAKLPPGYYQQKLPVGGN